MATMLEARLAVEWLEGSGPRTRSRLSGLVDHWLGVYGIQDPDLRAHALREAEADAARLIGWQPDA